ncbi:T9SS type A sorting domain-containing protein [Chitinophaga rhizophila]|uniref:T9SS type A sorting domain-containing protein n=1 Tax=Chitinophaga rhizophila TaxID=2866212 RepID=A0ABS7GBI9_9BACT|nr:T9SS type A sorting domain-containing protein [Chitinophaga rhizophila]MBW8685029.1 T9SS type A sorting domain-containing protein [Chitinophaga rhizophila]
MKRTLLLFVLLSLCRYVVAQSVSQELPKQSSNAVVPPAMWTLQTSYRNTRPCGDSVVLTAKTNATKGAYVITWTPGGNGDSILVTQRNRLYLASLKDRSGRVYKTDSLWLPVNEQFTARLELHQAPHRRHDTLYAYPLSFNLKYTYHWYKDNRFINSGYYPVMNGLTKGVYHVVVTDVATGCSSRSDTLRVDSTLGQPIDTTWKVNINEVSSSLCGDTVLLSTNVFATDNNYHLDWNTGESARSIYVQTPGLYTVALKDSYGNTRAVDSIIVTLPPRFIASLAVHRAPVPGNDTIVAYPHTPTFTGYFYKWYHNGAEVLTGNTPHLYQAVQGTYMVYIQSDAGCESWSDSITYYPSDTLNVTARRTPVLPAANGNISLNDVKVKAYPNPASELVYIQFDRPLSQKVTINVYSANGRLVQTRTTNQQQQQLDLSAQPKGFYLIELKTNGAKKTISILLQ